MKSPCRDCEKRYPGCQDKCEEGQAYKAWVARRNIKIRDSRQKVSAAHKGWPKWREV